MKWILQRYGSEESIIHFDLIINLFNFGARFRLMTFKDTYKMLKITTKILLNYLKTLIL